LIVDFVAGTMSEGKANGNFQMRHLAIITAAMAWLLLPPAGSANPPFLCGQTNRQDVLDVSVRLAGNWIVYHHVGWMDIGVIGMIYPATEPEPLRLAHQNGKLIVTGFEGIEQSIELVPSNEPPWEFRRTGRADSRVLTSQEISQAAGCDAADLPRLIGTMPYGSRDAQMQFTLRLIVMHENTMFGVLDVKGHHVTSGPFHSRRSVLMSR
jgi:hypothetical protein